ncbi:hypothetical protein TNCV_4957781 [Trichonephila clavipes]|nr:hypothetical protein TNCV_4957781 [Trichonephila clavipes]
MSTMSQRSHLTDSEAWRAVGRLEAGQTQAEGILETLYLSPRSKADFGTVEIAKERSEFGASELTQTRCGITESEPFLRILATRGLLATDHVILIYGQVTWKTPELAPSSSNYQSMLMEAFELSTDLT